MFSGGSYEEVGRWLWNFVLSHAKREDGRIEAEVDTSGPHEGKSYGVRLRLGERREPPFGAPALEFPYPLVAEQRGHLAWCQSLAQDVRAVARKVLAAEIGARRSA
ncbi:MAG: hypothetical protein L0027_17475 [Candidatus Rokubacteria bacterium]|nr:hypothetical protein [Candidatus Rokubacteria bacterium]